MKIVLSVTAPGIEAPIDPRFGRGATLLVVDTDTMQADAHPNPGVNASGGAGVQAAQFAAGQKAEAVISGDFGPNAFDALKAAGVAMYLYGDCQTARQAIERFQAGQLQQVGAPTQSGHHG
ncbi:MAG: Dinitrogenase iron-molybdenum cofactor biosynthesi [Anaerolineaceae bacterium]|nr:MAG: Dinitrogenase iron-molybdenum cofactor biosynthesi [Anaerolineaceae bacterium]